MATPRIDKGQMENFLLNPLAMLLLNSCCKSLHRIVKRKPYKKAIKKGYVALVYLSNRFIYENDPTPF